MELGIWGSGVIGFGVGKGKWCEEEVGGCFILFWI